MAPDLTLLIENRHPAVVVRLSGEMAGLHIYKLKNDVEALVAGGSKYVVLDLADLEFIESAGLGSIMYIRGLCRQVGGLLVLVPPVKGEVAKLLGPTLGQGGIASFPDTRAALGHLADQFGLDGLAGTLRAGDAPEPVIPPSTSAASADFARIEERLGRIERLLQELLRRP